MACCKSIVIKYITTADFCVTHDSLVSLTVMDRNVISVLKTYFEECVTKHSSYSQPSKYTELFHHVAVWH